MSDHDHAHQMELLSLGISDLHLLMDLDVRLSVRGLRASIAPAYVKKNRELCCACSEGSDAGVEGQKGRCWT
jgi:hypothetical protein